MSSSAHTNNKIRNILVLGRDFIKGIDGTTIYAEKLYSIILVKLGPDLVSICAIIEIIVICLSMVKK